MSGAERTELLAAAKKALRISGDDFDNEVDDLIDAALLDMETTGIDTDRNFALIKQAVNTYVKAYFGIENPDAERLMESYQLQIQKLAIGQPVQGGDES